MGHVMHRDRSTEGHSRGVGVGGNVRTALLVKTRIAYKGAGVDDKAEEMIAAERI